jgi:hypothetical protein
MFLHLVNFIVLCSLLELAVSQASWPQSGGNAQHTGLVMPAIGTGFLGNGSIHFGGPGVMRSSLLMSRDGVFYAASVATGGYDLVVFDFLNLSVSHA